MWAVVLKKKVVVFVGRGTSGVGPVLCEAGGGEGQRAGGEWPFSRRSPVRY